MVKVVALEPIVGSYPVAKGETPDYTQKESRARGDTGELVQVAVGYKSLRVTLALERAATPGDLQDDAARVKDGKPTRIAMNGKVPILLLPGMVYMSGQTIEGDPGENPEFDLPDATAKEWAAKGLVKIVGAAAPATDAPPPADPRLVAKRKLTAPEASA